MEIIIFFLWLICNIAIYWKIFVWCARLGILSRQRVAIWVIEFNVHGLLTELSVGLSKKLWWTNIHNPQHHHHHSLHCHNSNGACLHGWCNGHDYFFLCTASKLLLHLMIVSCLSESQVTMQHSGGGAVISANVIIIRLWWMVFVIN